MESGPCRATAEKEVHSEKRTTNDDHCEEHCNQHQRLIPLTKEIELAMMDFNASQSNTSISEKPFYNTFSITSLVREEVHNILQELSISEHFIRKEEIDDLIERCLKEKVTVLQEDEECKTTTASESDTNQELEVTVEMIKENDKNNLIVENFQILEQRITSLEERISTVLQTIPKLRHLQAKKFKINTEVIREELRQFMDKVELNAIKEPVDETEVVMVEEPKVETTIEELVNIYDDMYYEQRQNAMNLLNYKKSIATMELNERPHINPHIKPIKMEYPATSFKPKQKPMFICNEG